MPIETLTEESFGKHWLWGRVMGPAPEHGHGVGADFGDAKVAVPVAAKDAAVIV